MRTLLLLIGLLAACGPKDTPPEKTFSIRLEPAVLNLRVTETGNVKVIVSRSGGFSEAVMVTLGGENTGLTADPLSIPAASSEGTLSFRVSDAAKIGTSFPVVQAKSGAISKSETLTLRVAKAVAEATKITVKDNAGSVQVRQGFGNVTLEVEGKNLERVTAFKLGDLEVSALPGRTSNQLELGVKVPHGANPGAKALVLTAAGGDTTFPAALFITPITSGPAGNDSTGAGTTDKPYRTMKKALSLSQPGDTVRLLNGTYTASSGETWPAFGTNVTPNVPPAVKVEGESRDGAVLEGPGTTSKTVGLAFSDDSGAKTLTVRGFAAGLFVGSGNVTLESVLASGNAVGFGVNGGSIKASEAEFKGNKTGILLTGMAILEVSGGSSHDNSDRGVVVGGKALKLQAKDFEVFGNTTGLFAAGGAEVRLEGVKIHDNRDHGLKASEQATLSLTASELYENARAGLWFSGKRLVARGTTIRDNKEFGLYVEGSPDKVDFGSFTEPGNNDLHTNGPNGTGDQILDVRSDRATLGDPESFTLSATRLNGVTPAADIYPGDGKWPYLNAPYFSILGTNNLIRVY
ncbi:MAG: hypothetical protein C4327_08365 [Meiothermus sp.]